MKIYNDDKLLEMLSYDNEQAFRLIYEKYFPIIFSFLLRECYSQDLAKDLTQDVFLKLWNVRSKLIVTDSLKSYLFKIAQNIYIDYLRKSINQRVFEMFSEQILFYEENLNDMDQELIDKLMELAEKMPEKRKEVFRLRWIKGLSRKEIAQQMGISIVTVDIHMRKAVVFLKEQVKIKKLACLLFLFLPPL